MNTLEFLKANEYRSDRDFVSKAQYLNDNWYWLKYSYAIAIKVRGRMRDLGITQKELASLLGCTQQHISALLGGKSNMTLETLAKLEKALSFDIIGRGLNVSPYAIPNEEALLYLNDFSATEPIPDGVKTSQLVDGFKPRKKKGPKK